MNTNLFEEFMNKEVIIKTSDTNYIGKLISVDGYLNVVLENCIIQNEKEEKESIIFIKGNFVEHINLK